MSFFSRFPYTDFHRLNADWILNKVKEASEAVETALQQIREVAASVAGAVRFDQAQTLSSAEQAQARDNIGAAPSVGVVRYDVSMALDANNQARARDNVGAASAQALLQLNNEAVKTVSQQLTEYQKAVARANIDAAAAGSVPTGAVLYDQAQVLTAAQQQQARANIGAAAEGSAPTPAGAVLYDQAQTLTGAQQNQARANIGAAANTDPNLINSVELLNSAAAGGEGDEIRFTVPSVVDQSKLLLAGQQSDEVILSGIAAPVNDSDAANKAYADSIRGPYLSTIAGSDAVIQPDAATARNNTLYVCSAAELNSLEIVPVASPAANREFTVRFTSGATPTELTTPLTILGLDDLVPAENTIYEINVLGNLAVWHSWEVSA